MISSSSRGLDAVNWTLLCVSSVSSSSIGGGGGLDGAWCMPSEGNGGLGGAEGSVKKEHFTFG